ncbi:HD family hydrolase [Campylobacter canadensis]|uniref:HD family hydrolase n=1 Tax=Campylobacter canadensis TaxID=449520 RepID=A0ABS7WVN2_9BACT|nr:HD domain-containing protein [Campylobacter canadensis]MBZ7987984.1 HD family hydrolase [Campylobacter canadensis]MBZ7995430.1 HD family hydrolase [Campylobacter canadensis]MBZ7996990.1 HD family hydrolase [Campylobacter canadensis]MBZ7998946.1 HD family hydrolase [Campylobacter canadensis]MBZ8000746.1 HD family hydrolase [Campylobacter canadensis]
MISAELVLHIFKAASISRWNDFARISNLVELDKQAHKAVIAYFLAKSEKNIDMRFLLDAIVVEFISRVIVTDIRPDVLNEIKKTKQKELNHWIIKQFENMKTSKEFSDIFKNYYLDTSHEREKFILKAAGFLSTKYEFNFIYPNVSNYEEIKNKLDEELEDYLEILAVQKIALNQKLAKVIDLSGRLRFQKRWAQTPRIPETSVLGHMLVVAILSYFYCLKIKACDERIINNFFCALFHDLPESLTRDIITPVKYGVQGLDEILSDYEVKLIDEKILPNVPYALQKEFSYLLGLYNDENKIKKNEFTNRILVDNEIKINIDLDKYNENKYMAIDGKVLKACDKTAAFLEALISIYYGVKSKDLLDGINKIKDSFLQNQVIGNINFYDLICGFENYFLDPSQDTCGTQS